MIQALPTANFSLSFTPKGAASTGATSRLAPLLVAPTKTIATYSGGGAAATPDAVTTSDLAPPSVQQYAVSAVAAPGMSMTTKVLLFGGLTLVVGAAIIVATKR